MYVLLIYVLLILSIGLQKIHFGIRILEQDFVKDKGQRRRVKR